MSDKVEIDLKNTKAKKMMLWFGMISMAMMFAGLTSSIIVSGSRPDWLDSFSMPTWFLVSTFSIVFSSVFFQLAKVSLDKYAPIENSNLHLHRKNVNIYLCFTATLAIIFVVSQFLGLGEIISLGFHFTGPGSSVTTSFIYVLVCVHLVHLFAGLIVLSVVIIRFNNKKYEKNKLGFELALMFWHFLGALWTYLFLFIKYFT
jgi:cytochrome c oxidase subunit 3